MATESFTGTAGDLLTTMSTSWTQNKGTMYTNGTACYDATSGTHSCYHWNAESFTDDQSSELVDITWTGAGSYLGVTVRAAGSAVQTFYLFDTNINGDSYLVVYDAGSPTTLGNVSDGARATNDDLLLSVTGTTLDPQINGATAAMGTIGNGVISSGSPGVGGFNGGTSQYGDSWEGLSLAAATGNPWYYYANQ